MTDKPLLDSLRPSGNPATNTYRAWDSGLMGYIQFYRSHTQHSPTITTKTLKQVTSANLVLSYESLINMLHTSHGAALNLAVKTLKPHYLV